MYVGKLFYNRPGEIKAKDDNWLGTFQLLSQLSKLIISVPIDLLQTSDNSATILELIDINEKGLLNRCLFVMPPEQSVLLKRPKIITEGILSGRRIWTTHEFTISTLWESTRSKLTEVGIQLPAFTDTKNSVKLFTIRGGKTKMLDLTASELDDLCNHLPSLGVSL